MVHLDKFMKERSKPMMTLKIDGMTCASCAEHVRQALENVPGVRSAAVSWSEALADVTADEEVSHDTLAAAVTTAGYHARVADVATQSAGLPGKALSPAGAGGKRSGDDGAVGVAVIGSGGAAVAAAPVAAGNCPPGPPVQPRTPRG